MRPPQKVGRKLSVLFTFTNYNYSSAKINQKINSALKVRDSFKRLLIS